MFNEEKKEKTLSVPRQIMAMYLGRVEQLKQEHWFSAFVGMTGCGRNEDKESLTLTGTGDCLIV